MPVQTTVVALTQPSSVLFNQPNQFNSMKTIKAVLWLCLFGLLAWAARAQGTFEFTAYLHGTNVVPPSPAFSTGTGVFTLDGFQFGGEVRTDFLSGFDAVVYGPAEPGANGPALFTLQLRGCAAPSPPFPGYCRWVGTNTISYEQIPDLLAGRWYIQVTDTFFPELASRGQIILVPEPGISIFVLLGLFALGLAMCIRGREACLAASRNFVPHRFNSTNQTSSIP